MEKDEDGEPWRTRLALLKRLSEWALAEPGLDVALRTIATGDACPVDAEGLDEARAFAAALAREWAARG